MKFTALGGGIPLGGSHHILNLEEGRRVAFDCGAIQSQGGKISAPPIAEGNIDALFATHGHFDHVGMLPLFGKTHPETPIYGTEVTRRFASMLLGDSLKITRKKIEAGEKNAQAYFNIADAIRVLTRHERYKQVLRPEWFELKPGWKIRFWPAGHINGAVSSQIITPKGLKIMHSGDISFTNMPTIKGADIAPDFRPDVLITEATYGDRDLPNRAAEEQRFVNRVIEVLRRGGQVLIPAFGITGPNIAITLARGLTAAGIDTPIHIDGMIRKAARIIYGSSEWNAENKSVPFPDNIICMPDGREGYIHRQRLLSGPAVILASHGMLEGGKIMEYLPTVLSNPLGAILIPGYQADGTGGRKLLELERGANFLIPGFGQRKGEVVPIYCDVERFYLSSHASGPELANWIEELDPKVLIVVHATAEGFAGLKRRFQERAKRPLMIIPAFNGEEISIDECLARRRV